ncbi:glycoside hydrolase family 43 protein [Rhizosphaericola mali]|uniref:Family 43 glycosylhydrolase n=1 Tax=Rhizosphaericola mali TaxID=2545455 RepID=A0A5P2G1K6_9BACT|nr:glycoside hydrolase family 43 protein [Rhizosphaericola mali]QES88578.1 family 43 glycosylhydrolase [Rhizosphaericola mali]
MKTIFRFILPLGVLGIVTCSKNNSSSQNVIIDSSNIFMADPTMFYQDGKYYLSGTYEPDTRDGIRIFSSDNMHSFSNAGNKIVLKNGAAYGTDLYWAPQFWSNNGQANLLYTANEHIAYATSSSIDGPFSGQNKPIIADRKNIDPFLYTDDDGKKYLFHVEFPDGTNRIYTALLNDDNSGIDESSNKVSISPTERWETVMGKVTEGPTVLKHNGVYYLIYSANDFRSQSYAVGYATSTSITGPWIKYSNNPILSKENTGYSGTGHGDVFTGADNQMYYIFHTHNSDSAVTPRKTAITRMFFEKNPAGGPDILKMAIDEIFFPKVSIHN